MFEIFHTTLILECSDSKVNFQGNVMNALKTPIEQDVCEESGQTEGGQPFQISVEDEEGEESKPRRRAAIGTRNLHRYLKDVRQYRDKGLLSYEECCRLAERARNGDIGARNEIVVRNLGLVLKIAWYYKWITRESVFGYDDVIQWGNMGLMEAAARFLKDRAAFSTYGRQWIRQSILRELTKAVALVRIPVFRDEQRRRVAKALSRNATSGTMPFNTEDAENIKHLVTETGLSKNAVRLAIVLKEGKVTCTLESTMETGEDTDEWAIAPDHALMLREEVEVGCHFLRAWWNFLLTNGRQREAYIFLRRYKLAGGDWLEPSFKLVTLEEVGLELGYTRVRRIAALSCSLGIPIEPKVVFPMEKYRPLY